MKWVCWSHRKVRCLSASVVDWQNPICRRRIKPQSSILNAAFELFCLLVLLFTSSLFSLLSKVEFLKSVFLHFTSKVSIGVSVWELINCSFFSRNRRYFKESPFTAYESDPDEGYSSNRSSLVPISPPSFLPPSSSCVITSRIRLILLVFVVCSAQA